MYWCKVYPCYCISFWYQRDHNYIKKMTKYMVCWKMLSAGHVMLYTIHYERAKQFLDEFYVHIMGLLTWLIIRIEICVSGVTVFTSIGKSYYRVHDVGLMILLILMCLFVLCLRSHSIVYLLFFYFTFLESVFIRIWS